MQLRMQVGSAWSAALGTCTKPGSRGVSRILSLAIVAVAAMAMSTPVNAQCVDGQPCTGDIDCGTGACQDMVCSDGNACLTDADCIDGSNCRGACVCKCAPPGGQDCFLTPCDGTTFVDFSANPLPADFFFAGSPPFSDTVGFGGVGGGPDTVVRRNDIMCFAGPGATAGPIPVEIIQLQLKSCSPVIVDGAAFDLYVNLDPGTPSLGDLTAIKTHPNGGTFTSNLNVNVLVTAAPFGGAPVPPGAPQSINLSTVAPAPWVQNNPGSLCNSTGFFPGYDGTGGNQPCCEPVCHQGPTPDHPHCVEPPDCDPCPSNPPDIPCPPQDPTNDPCSTLAQTQCQLDPNGIETCNPTLVQVQAGFAVTVGCECKEQECGPVLIEPDPVGQLLSCPGPCPSPPGGNCEIFIDGLAQGANSVHSLNVPDGALVTCDCVDAPPPPDPHNTVPGTQINFNTADVPAIPANFFDPGSDPFLGTIQLQEGTGDTIGQRSGPIVCPPFVGPPVACTPVQIELVQLDLVSSAPISVTGSDDWLVAIDLSPTGGGTGPMNATKTHLNGGTYNALMPVLPRMIFTRAVAPFDTRVLDYGIEGIPPIQLNFVNIPWVINLAPHLSGSVIAPSDGNFVPGVHEVVPGDPATQTVVPSPGPSLGGGVTHDVEPVQFCPVAGDPATDPCAPFRQTDCEGSVNDLCLQALVAVGLPPAGVDTLACSCFSDDECGQIQITIDPPTGFEFASCPGTCSSPDTPPCQLWMDDGTGVGVPTGQTTALVSSFPAGTLLYCDCAPPCPNPCQTPSDCDDGDACTTDVCDATGCCQNDPICTTDADCDDGNVCTVDSCRADGCCDNDPLCPGVCEVCNAATGGCDPIPGCCETAADCNDNNPCTTDDCDLTTNTCVYTPDCVNNSDCDDGNVCTTDVCNAMHCCIYTPECQSDADCDDGDPCTIDSCDQDCCVHTPDPTCVDCQVQNGVCAGICPDSTEICQTKCAIYDPLTGQTTATECDCSTLDECHLEVSNVGNARAAQPVGGPCVIPEGPPGTVTLPPAGCDYLSPDEVHEITQGLPAGTTIEVDPIHLNFICGQGADAPAVCSIPLVNACETAGGTFGGNLDCFHSEVQMNISGTGLLNSFSRNISLSGVGVEVHTGPRTPGDAVQSFPTDMFRLQGELFGDPDFCTFRVTAGSDFGLPSPGQTTLTDLGNGTWNVDSFFDVTYRIEFQGCPGSVLEGFGGTTEATIRMQTGAQPTCVGGCPPGQECEESRIVQPDGTLEICCNCVEPTGACCLPGNVCVIDTATGCAAQGGTYAGDGTDCTDADLSGFADVCEPDECRVNDTATGCVGPCPDPPCEGECINGSYCDNPACCLDPNNCVCYAKNTKESIKRCGDCFGECINGAYCDGPDPDCCIVPGACACYLQNTDISIQLCQDNSCFGECVPGPNGPSYCDGPDDSCCLAGPGNCQCYAPNDPISIKLCADPIPQPQECNASCVTVDPLTGAVTVTDCDCKDGNECHVNLAADTSTGGFVSKAGGGANPCVVPDDAGGTVTLPPAGCEYLSPDEVHEILDTAGPGITFEFAPIHKDFICSDRNDQMPGCPPPGVCEDTGGDLGGNVDCFESVLEATVSSPDLPGFNRTLNIPIMCQAHTGPRTPGADIQSFDTKMHLMQGEIFGDPDFDVFRITGGDGNGLPSPGHTTLTRLPSGDFTVDSFFDVTYQIEFQGRPGSVLEGMGGITTGTIRMRTGTTPDCEGSCDPGETCTQQRTVNSDGTVQMCCVCGCPQVDPVGPELPTAIEKNRYISVTPANPGRLTALRVTYENLDGAYSVWNGRQMWVTNPKTITEQSGSDAAAPAPTMTAAGLSCVQDCRDWGALGTIDIYHEGVVPGSTYTVEAIDCDCDPADPANYSAPMGVSTSKFGDLVGVFDGPNCDWTPPNTIVSIPTDTVSMINKFQNLPCSPRKARTDMIGVPPNAGCVDHKITVGDFVQSITAFTGLPYGLSPSANDPCAVTCP